MAANWFSSPVAITLGTTGTWNSVSSATSGIPAGASAAILRYKNNATQTKTAGFRQTGTTVVLNGTQAGSAESSLLCGVDSSGSFDYYISATTCNIWVLGYMDAGDVVWFSSPTNLGTLTSGAYTTVDISSYLNAGDSALGVILDWAGGGTMEIRPNGSTDNDYNATQSSHIWITVGVTNNKFDYKVNLSNASPMTLCGYVKDGMAFNTNGTVDSIGTASSWINLPTVGSLYNGVLYEVCNASVTGGFRPNGSSDTTTGAMGSHSWQMCNTGTGNVVQTDMSSTTIKVKEIGYFLAPASGGGYDVNVSRTLLTF